MIEQSKGGNNFQVFKQLLRQQSQEWLHPFLRCFLKEFSNPHPSGTFVGSPYGVNTDNKAEVVLGFGAAAIFYLEQQWSPLAANSVKGNIGVTWNP